MLRRLGKRLTYVNVVSLLLVGFLLGVASPVSAHIVSWQPLAFVPFPDTDTALAIGTINCSGGEVYTVGVTVNQKDPGYRGRGTDRDVCIGSITPQWRVDVAPVSGDLVAGVRMRVVFVVRTFTGSGVDDKEVFVYFFTP
jgi:hypothetical protein